MDLPADPDRLPQSSAMIIQERSERLAATLEAIETMSLTELRKLWEKHFGTPPALRSTDLMRLSLSWRLQARVNGGFDAATRRQLRRKTTTDPSSAISLEVGTKLCREWQGQPYEIEVTVDGFRWKDQTYPSLSAVAMTITGTRWNGPRFFGLRKGAQ